MNYEDYKNVEYYSQKYFSLFLYDKIILPFLMNRSSFGETMAGWIVNASWAWPASYWRSWIWQTWWLAGTSFSPPLLWWIPRWLRWSATAHSSLWRAPSGRAVNAHKTNNSTRFIFLWKGSHSPPILRVLVVHDCGTWNLWNVLEFLQNKWPFCNIPELTTEEMLFFSLWEKDFRTGKECRPDIWALF